MMLYPGFQLPPQVVHKLEQAVFPGASHKVTSFYMEDKKLSQNQEQGTF